MCRFWPRLLTVCWRFIREGKPSTTKTDDFSELFQTAFKPPKSQPLVLAKKSKFRKIQVSVFTPKCVFFLITTGYLLCTVLYCTEYLQRCFFCALQWIFGDNSCRRVGRPPTVADTLTNMTYGHHETGPVLWGPQCNTRWSLLYICGIATIHCEAEVCSAPWLL